MPATDPLGRDVPSDTDAADLAQILRRYSLSDVGITQVGSHTQANQLLADVNAAATTHGIPRRPIAVWRTDALGGALELHPNTGAAGEQWEWLGGRQHAALVEVSRPALNAGGTPWLLYVDRIVKASPGWTVVNNRLVVPAPGLYSVEVVANVDGISNDLGRVFGQVAVNGNPQQKRFATAVNENNYSGIVMLDATAGAQIQPTHYHAAGGARDVTGTMMIYTAANPSW